MPSGEVHYRFYNAGFIIEIPEAVYLTTLSPAFGISHLIGYFCHRWVDNDWDIVSINKSEGRLINELKLLGYALFGISSIYGAVFRHKHRSFLTHFPIISTFIRMFFIFGLPLFILVKLGYTDGHFWTWSYFWGFLLGLSQADLQHFLADMFWTENYFNSEKKKRK